MPESSRPRRVGELVQRELAGMLQREVKDPRLAMVSITAVDVTRDMSLARVYYTLIGSDHNTPEVKDGLKKASGFLRHELAKRVQLRIVPRLEFRYDESVLKGAELSRLIDNAVAEDQKRHIDDDVQDHDDT